MKCKLCSHEAPHPRAISDHWKSEHPIEYKKKQKAKKARAAAAAEPLDEVTTEVDPEMEAMLALVATIDARDEAEEPIFDLAARARILRYVAHRAGLIFGIANAVGELSDV